MYLIDKFLGLSRKNKITVLIFGVFLLLYIYTTWYPTIVRYKDFGIRIPNGYKIHGIDVSRYQGDIVWKEVEKMRSYNMRIEFAFIKATEGISLEDPKFKKNWRNIKRTTLKRGAYHFFRANYSGKTQAKHFLSKAKFEDGDLFPVMDLESMDGMSIDAVRKRALEFLSYIENRLGVTPIIYTNLDFHKRIFNSPEFIKYPIWVAHYTSNDEPRLNHQWFFWQHSETGHVNSIKENVDFNVFNGDYQDFSKLTF